MTKTSKYRGLPREEKLELLHRELERKAVSVQALRNSNSRKKPFRSSLFFLYGVQGNQQIKPGGIVALVQSLSAKLTEPNREFFNMLLFALEEQNCKRLLADEKFIRAIFNMARFSVHAVSKPKGWQSPSYNTGKQFSSIVRFCFAKYEVPGFMDQAWFGNQDAHMEWFVKLAQGESLRDCHNVPIRLTKRIVHHFMQAESMTIVEALRWAQVLGMGGDLGLAYMVTRSLLGRNNFEREAFWETAIQLFAKQGMVEPNKFNQVIDFLNTKSREDATYSMKGRTMKSLIRLTEEWHRQVHRIRTSSDLAWERSGIRRYIGTEGKDDEKKTYTIIELLSSKELSEEGEKMKHCVGSYAYACYQKRCSIFSVRAVDKSRQESRVGTIEVDLVNKRIVQAKAKQNVRMDSEAARVMRKWASNEQLTISNYL